MQTSGAGALAHGEHTAIIDGLEQRYHVAGRGPVCVVHSGGPGVSWEYMRMPAVEAHLTTVYLEPIGTGASGRLADPSGYTLDRYLHFLDGLVEHLGVERTFVLGHSHGGFVAQRYALARPERLAGLILYATSPVTDAEFWAEAGRGLGRFAERHSARPETADTLAAFGELRAAGADPGTTDEQTTTIFRRMFPGYCSDYWHQEGELGLLRASVRMYAGPLRGEGPPFDLRNELGSIAAPTLVIVGPDDPVCSPRWSQLLHDGIPASRLVILEGSGHFPHLEQPRAFANTIADFVQHAAPDERPRA